MTGFKPCTTTCNIQQCWELLANNVALVCTGLKVRQVSNLAQQHPTAWNWVCKRTQHVTSNNVGSCWPTILRSFARSSSNYSVQAPVQWTAQLVFVTLICWIVIYPKDSTVQHLNNLDRVWRFLCQL